uniref:NADH-ubiquinone oxidoreductase chain 2 n=1 Tax=Paratimomenus flavocapitatus TaxID=2021295 RepID=A0A678RW95_9NEOP|nr:NADH dehydrogenase subunit 2 [Paratimomenus flavocapitatus]
MQSGIYKSVFLMFLVSGTFMVINASTWFNAWAGLELNMLSFIPLMIRDEEILSAEAGLKYFLIQTIASLILITVILKSSILFNLLKGWGSVETWGVGGALGLKLGMAPLHFWLPSLAKDLSWSNLMILLVWQKIAPLKLMSGIDFKDWILGGLIISCIWVGGVGGFSQTSLAKLMSYSSITHMGWIGAAFKLDGEKWVLYFGVYSLLVLSMMWVFQREGCYILSHLWLNCSMSLIMKITLFVGLLSMGGLPPLLGFFPKWMVIEMLINVGDWKLGIYMALGSLITLFYYFRMGFVIFMHFNSNPNVNIYFKEGGKLKNNFGWIFLGLNLVGLGYCGIVGL